jgi:hypothetical protein
MQSSGTVEVSTVKTALAVSQRCLTAMRDGHQRLHEYGVVLFISAPCFDICDSSRAERIEIWWHLARLARRWSFACLLR